MARLTVEEIKRWLDAQIGSNAIQNMVLEEGKVKISNISAVNTVHMRPTVVRLIAERLDIELGHSIRKDIDYPHTIYFTYNDTKFFGLESEEEYQKNGAVE